jgi:hypothetical protein
MLQTSQIFLQTTNKTQSKARGRYDPTSRTAWQDEISASETPAENATGAVTAPV